ncbi:hypothetical protein EHE19_013465 [Ruminiclostridium herbifermentans]|uniref:Uncharacterized protein n=1 Tax=Ruminiclostridium herbifermentans TaxID=2488810 RepID=A0A4U7JAE9_9FIRM|nr:hypothetical protein [Ruminiclostridium herbifermentans]QNU65893.1 hypothetical protein EHE19_013465 [Ruminiclostridium herbifermentans]
MKNAISNIFAFLWFFGVLLWVILFMLIAIPMIFFINIMGMINTGFATSTIGLAFVFLSGFILAITGWVPAFRKCYIKLPWLYPLSSMLMIHLIILSIAEEILAKGYAVISAPRHTVTLIIMIVQIIACRIAMCFYFYKKPLIVKKGEI